MKNFWFETKKPILALAPMAGITDSAFRQICKQYGADVTYSEMASVSALFFKPQKTLDLIKFKKSERPYVVQLFGNNPEHFAKAAEIITKKVRPDGIDINFGCPAKKVFGHGSGCALMPQKKLARQIIKSVCENTHLPVSLKIRAGLKTDKDLNTHPSKKNTKNVFFSALEFIENTRDLPYSAVMLHGRIYEAGFSGPVNFSVVEKIKKIIPEKIILANGGINSAQEAVEVLHKYPTLDGLGIARGAWGQPWIFEEIKSLLDCYPEFSPVSYDLNKTKKIILQHAKLIYKDKGQLGLFEIRKHLAWYVKGFPGAAEIRRQLVSVENLKEIKEILKKI